MKLLKMAVKGVDLTMKTLTRFTNPSLNLQSCEYNERIYWNLNFPLQNLILRINSFQILFKIKRRGKNK